MLNFISININGHQEIPTTDMKHYFEALQYNKNNNINK